MFEMKKSINIDEIIWAKANIEAEKRNMSIDDLVKQALEVFLGMDTKKI
jgi:macrodomain Ter protein organizer (MatP/YcbG family)